MDCWEISSMSVWSEKISLFRQKRFCLATSFQRYLPFVRTKSRLKNRVTAVHLLQCKTKFLHSSMLQREKSTQIKEHPLWETFINIKKKHFFDSFKLAYIHLHLSSDSSTHVYIRLVTRLHLSTFVYTRLHSSRLL